MSIAKKLEIEFGAAIMHTEGQVFLEDGPLVEFRESFHRGDRHRYRTEFMMKSFIFSTKEKIKATAGSHD